MVTGREDTCFGETRRGRDYMGLVSFGFFLLVVGIIFIANPNIISDFGSWIENMADRQDLLRPPEGLLVSGTLFFGLIGAFNFFQGGIRFLTRASKRQALVDVLTGIAWVLFAYLIHLYSIYRLEWQLVLAFEVVAVGLLVILYSVIRQLYLTRPSTWKQ